MKRTLQAFAALCGGRFSGEDRAYSGVSTDTRSLRAGEIYLALRGPRFDGNEFWCWLRLQAPRRPWWIARGCTAAAVIEVSDGPRPGACRSRCRCVRVQGSGGRHCGSNGKTTVNGDDLVHPWHRRGPCLARAATCNNQYRLCR